MGPGALPFGLWIASDRTLVPPGRTLVTQLRRAVERGGSGVAITLRERDLPQSERRALAEELVGPCVEAGALLFVSADAELANAVGAAGLSLPDGAPVPSAERRGGLRWVGSTVHDEQGALRLAGESVDFVVISPIGAVPGKGTPLGWTGFHTLGRRCARPAVALGGLGPGDFVLARCWGAAAVGVQRAVLSAMDPARAVQDHLAAWAQAAPEAA